MPENTKSFRQREMREESDSGNTGRLFDRNVQTGKMTELYAGLIPLADTSISIGALSGATLFSRYASSSDDLVSFENVSVP